MSQSALGGRARQLDGQQCIDLMVEQAVFFEGAEVGRRATARSPGWLAWPLVLGERFPHTGARKSAPRASSRRRARSLRRIGLVDQK
jgi:hypothetical protein